VNEHAQRKGFGANKEEFEAVSFCCGPIGDQNGWASLSVFGLLKSGDLITICPVVPNISNLSLAWVQNTLKTSIEMWSQVQDKAESVQYYWVQKWLEEVLEQDACTYKF
jgi:hypothetical protein